MEGIELLTNNLLLIGLLAVFFFFGDWIYKFIKTEIKDSTKTVIGDFFLILIAILILSILPLIISQLMIQFLPMKLNIGIMICLLGVCFWKYYSEE